MSSATVNDPFTLATYVHSKRSSKVSARDKNESTRDTYIAHTRRNQTDGYVTVSVPQDGLHVFDVRLIGSYICVCQN
jgi:hypothetical protein